MSETRTAAGRFTPGNRGGPGGMSTRVHAIRRALLDAISPGDVTGIIDKLVSKAKAGDTESAKLVLGYIAGSPDRIHDHVDAERREEVLKVAMNETKN